MPIFICHWKSWAGVSLLFAGKVPPISCDHEFGFKLIFGLLVFSLKILVRVKSGKVTCITSSSTAIQLFLAFGKTGSKGLHSQISRKTAGEWLFHPSSFSFLLSSPPNFPLLGTIRSWSVALHPSGHASLFCNVAM